MHRFSGLGSPIPPLRRWGEEAPSLGVSVSAYRNTGGSEPLRTVQQRQHQRARSLFQPTFAVQPAGYGMMPRANTGSAVSALSGLSGWFTTDEADACYAELAELRKQVERRLSRLSKGIQYTAQSLLDSTKDNSKSCATNKALIQQVLDMAINDLRAQVAAAPKTAKEIAAGAPAGSEALATINELQQLQPSSTMKYVGIGLAAVGGLVLLGVIVAAARNR